MKKGAKSLGCLILSPFIITGGIFPFVGIILIIVGISLDAKMNNKTQNYIETKGYYKSCTYITTSDEGYDLYKLNYEYTANGETYLVSTDYSTNNIPNIGDEETVKYNPHFPSQAEITSNTMAESIIFMGAIFTFVPFVMVVPIVIIIIIFKSKNIRTMERMNKEYQNTKVNKTTKLTSKIDEDNNDDINNDDPIKNL